MNLEEMQTKAMNNAVDYGKRCNITIDEEFALLKLYEEVGEFAKALLIHRKKCRPEKCLSEDASKKELAKELADVLGMVLVNAHLLNIDLSDALNKKWFNKEK
jgi:NTP pyrophosphatase (non-canonical NTP hydrolase)